MRDGGRLTSEVDWRDGNAVDGVETNEMTSMDEVCDGVSGTATALWRRRTDEDR
jgi:hypothetical protein